MTTLADRRLRQEAGDWIKVQASSFDIAACWHLPNSKKAAERLYDDIGFKTCLGHYFNVIDAKVFKSAYRRHRIRIKRIIVLERAADVGWHAHGLLSSDGTGCDRQDLMALIERTWLKTLRHYAHGRFTSHLVEASEHLGSYGDYMTKALSMSSDALAQFDADNSWLG